MLQNAGGLYVATYKCAWRHSGVPFFDIWPSKSGPDPSVFYDFDLKMCFSPKRRAIFPDRDLQNGSGAEVFCTFWLANVLRATAACHFWTSELPKWLLHPQFFNILTFKCASRHSGVPFLNIGTSKMAPTPSVFYHFDFQMRFAPQARAIFHLSARTATSAPAALASLLFEHQGPRFIEKTQRFATSLTFGARGTSFYWLYTHVDLLASDLTLRACLTAVLLCFFNSAYCRKLDF